MNKGSYWPEATLSELQCRVDPRARQLRVVTEAQVSKNRLHSLLGQAQTLPLGATWVLLTAEACLDSQPHPETMARPA